MFEGLYVHTVVPDKGKSSIKGTLVLLQKVPRHVQLSRGTFQIRT